MKNSEGHSQCQTLAFCGRSGILADNEDDTFGSHANQDINQHHAQTAVNHRSCVTFLPDTQHETGPPMADRIVLVVRDESAVYLRGMRLAFLESQFSNV